MAKNVIIIASGETERRSLPHLLSHLKDEGIIVAEVRYPPRHRALSVEMAENLLKAAWYASVSKPDKFVVLIDADGKAPEEVLRPFRENLPTRIQEKITAALQFAVAQWHLEAWFFADITNLREYLGRDPGSVDPSTPDGIRNPKHHLQQLLGDRLYTAVISEEIAQRLDGPTIARRSPSFQNLVAAARNGTDF